MDLGPQGDRRSPRAATEPRDAEARGPARAGGGGNGGNRPRQDRGRPSVEGDGRGDERETQERRRSEIESVHDNESIFEVQGQGQNGAQQRNQDESERFIPADATGAMIDLMGEMNRRLADIEQRDMERRNVREASVDQYRSRREFRDRIDAFERGESQFRGRRSASRGRSEREVSPRRYDRRHRDRRTAGRDDTPDRSRFRRHSSPRESRESSRESSSERGRARGRTPEWQRRESRRSPEEGRTRDNRGSQRFSPQDYRTPSEERSHSPRRSGRYDRPHHRFEAASPFSDVDRKLSRACRIEGPVLSQLREDLSVQATVSRARDALQWGLALLERSSASPTNVNQCLESLARLRDAVEQHPFRSQSWEKVAECVSKMYRELTHKMGGACSAPHSRPEEYFSPPVVQRTDGSLDASIHSMMGAEITRQVVNSTVKSLQSWDKQTSIITYLSHFESLTKGADLEGERICCSRN